MSNSDPQDSALYARAEHVLAQTLGQPVRLVPGAQPEGGSGGSNVVRAALLDGPAHAPPAVILKQLELEPGETFDPSDADGSAPRFFNEWASLQFLTELGLAPELAPRFLGGDVEARLLIMEDLGDGPSLANALLGTDRGQAEAALAAYFRSLGRLNARTCGHAEQYRALRSGLGAEERQAQPALAEAQANLLDRLHAVAERLGVTPSAGCERDVRAAAAFSAYTGPLLCFSQSDTCPDNCAIDGDRVRFFDFEWGAFRSALNDGGRARSNFPTCWCVNQLPPELTRRLEAIYRAELVQGCPAAADDALFFGDLAKCCAFWTLQSFEFYGDLWSADWEWGIATARQRAMARCELLAATTEELGQLQALGATAATLAEKLRALWPETPPMPLYPPFRT